MSAPVVSVVTPAFNASATIADTIRSVLAQTVTDWEMIVVDDGSTDATLQVARSFDDARIRCIAMPHTGTPAAARNRGIEEARAPRVAFIDADDMWMPNFLERELAVLEETGATLAHCHWVNLRGGRLYLEPAHCPPGILGPPELLRLLVRQHVLSCIALVVERRALLDVGLFDPDPGLAGQEDLDLWFRLAPHARFVHLPEPLFIVRIRDESISRNVRGNLSGTILALEKLRRREPGLVASIADDYRRRLAQLLFELGCYKVLNGSPGGGRAELIRSLRYRPASARTWLWLGLGLSGPVGPRTWARFRGRLAGRTAARAGAGAGEPR